MDVYKTARDVPKHIQKALINDINKVVHYISVNFDVYKRGTQQLISENQVLEQVLTELMIEESVCAAITKTGNKCIRKAQAESRYCRQHAFKAFIDSRSLHASSKQESPQHTSYLTFVDSEQTKNYDTIASLKKKVFIQDSFYWVDEQYIYDCTTYNKVGYIDCEKNKDSPNYVLTDDPFLLN